MAQTNYLRVNAAGFSGDGSSLICAYSPETDMLLVSRSQNYEGGEPKGKDGKSLRDQFLCLTNQQSDKIHDGVFEEEFFKDAIRAFFSRRDMRLINLSKDSTRFDPSNKIERDGVDQNGVRYRLADDITNPMVAVLIACYYAMKQKDVESANDFMEFMVISDDESENDPCEGWPQE